MLYQCRRHCFQCLGDTRYMCDGKAQALSRHPLWSLHRLSASVCVVLFQSHGFWCSLTNAYRKSWALYPAPLDGGSELPGNSFHGPDAQNSLFGKSILFLFVKQNWTFFKHSLKCWGTEPFTNAQKSVGSVDISFKKQMASTEITELAFTAVWKLHSQFCGKHLSTPKSTIHPKPACFIRYILVAFFSKHRLSPLQHIARVVWKACCIQVGLHFRHITRLHLVL